jgi:hypothetical protein
MLSPLKIQSLNFLGFSSCTINANDEVFTTEVIHVKTILDGTTNYQVKVIYIYIYMCKLYIINLVS